MSAVIRGSVVVLGAGSPMGRAIAWTYAEEGSPIILAGRDVEDLAQSAQDLRLRFQVEVSVEHFDALDRDSHSEFVKRCQGVSAQGLRGFVWSVGSMPEEESLRLDVAAREQMIDTNYTGALSVIELAADALVSQAQAGSFIAAITSVAGDRGRASNAFYGSSKAALSTYLGGLRIRLAGQDIRVVDVRPGFVDTAMTHGRPGMFLVAKPEQIAKSLCRGVARDRAVIYAPGFWRFIMLVIRTLPDFIFKRLSL